MNIQSPPVDVEITVESESLDRNAFYNVCFITENDVAPRTVEVATLSDLLSHGYTRDSLAYNFCLTVFAQQGISSVFVRAKRSNETFAQAFSSESNASYYFVVIDSKLDKDVKDFNEYLTSADEFKLQFYSSNTGPIDNSKLVHYTYDFNVRKASVLAGSVAGLSGDSINKVGRLVKADKVNFQDLYVSQAFKSPLTVESLTGYDYVNTYWVEFLAGNSLEYVGNTTKSTGRLGEYRSDNLHTPILQSDFQTANIAYPEAAWIAECANSFPSRVQWLHKMLVKPDVMKYSEVPDKSNTSAIVMNTKVTVGSGTTMQGIAIHEQVSLDWVKWAIGRKVWNLLYNTSKLPANTGGTELIKNEMKNVLDLAVEEGVFSKYIIKDISIAKDKETVKASFSATLMHSILGASISGSLYH